MSYCAFFNFSCIFIFCSSSILLRNSGGIYSLNSYPFFNLFFLIIFSNLKIFEKPISVNLILFASISYINEFKSIFIPNILFSCNKFIHSNISLYIINIFSSVILFFIKSSNEQYCFIPSNIKYNLSLFSHCVSKFIIKSYMFIFLFELCKAYTLFK